MPSIPEEPEVAESEVEQFTMPDFIKPLYDLDVVEGKEAVLKCRVAGLPYPSITWFHNGRKINSTDDRKMVQRMSCMGLSSSVFLEQLNALPPCLANTCLHKQPSLTPAINVVGPGCQRRIARMNASLLALSKCDWCVTATENDGWKSLHGIDLCFSAFLLMQTGTFTAWWSAPSAMPTPGSTRVSSPTKWARLPAMLTYMWQVKSQSRGLSYINRDENTNMNCTVQTPKLDTKKCHNTLITL